MEMVTLAFREEFRNPAHVTVGVFVGRNKGSRGRAGTLTLRADEWDEMQEAGGIEVLPKFKPALAF